MKILYAFPRIPFPESDGGAQAMADTVKLFHEMGHEMYFVGFDSEVHEQSTEELENYGTNCSVPGQFQQYTKVDAFKNLFSELPLQIAVRMRDSLFLESLEKVGDINFDIAFLDMIHVGKFIPLIRTHFPRCKIVVRSHNAEFQIITDLTANRNYLERFFLYHQSKKLKVFEQNVLDSSDGVIFLSEEDRAKFALPKMSAIIPPSISFSATKEQSKFRPHQFFMFGSWKWQPNEEGLRWFLDNVWTYFSSENPHATLRIAGGGLQLSLSDYTNTEYVGFLSDEDLNARIAESTAVIAPLFSGSGIKMKVLRAMAVGSVVIGNKKAFQGINATHQNPVVATPFEFLNSMKQLSTNESENKTIRSANLNFVDEYFSKKAISKKYSNFFEKVLSSKN